MSEIFITEADTLTVAYDEYLISLGVDVDAGQDYEVCECEMDYNCHLHADRQGTWIETRYAGQDEDEARAHGVYEREYTSYELAMGLDN